jgi:WD40 repeat protein/serine/threonine protein kinase
MAKCTYCHADISDATLQTGACPACGRPLAADAPAADKPAGPTRTVDGSNINQTLDASAFPAQAQAFDPNKTVDGGNIGQTLDASAFPAPAPKKPATIDERRIDQTLDASAFTPAATPSDPNKTIDGGRIDQTLDLSALRAAAAGGGDPMKTIDAVRLDQTIDGSIPDLPKPGTVRTIEQTIDTGQLSGEYAARMTRMWESANEPGVNPRMTVKGESRGGGKKKSTLVIQPRKLRTTEKQGPVDGAGGLDYELLDVLGEGGMGVVYAARQTSIDRTVAIKMVKSHAAVDDEQRAKFLSEAVVTGELEHPNIVPIYDLGANETGALFYSMKKVQGTPWSKVIEEKSLAENIEILMKVADAVAFAHSRGVVHRDLKPENVMLGGYGEVLVMDWGLALSMAGFRKSHNVTHSVGMGGTPAYMAPEMATGPFDRIGPASDIYLLGAILYEIVTGSPPHTGKTTIQCLFSAGKNEIIPTQKTGELINIALRAMASAPEDRFADVTTFQAAIREYQSHSESIMLSVRAEEDLKRGEESQEYQPYARALFGFQEALALWSGNRKARSLLSVAKASYARCAMVKGDYDLGLSLLDSDDPSHDELRGQLRAAQVEREARQQRLKNIKRVVVGLVVFIIGFVSFAYVQIRHQRDRALIAEGDARKAEGVAKTERDAAQKARDDAERRRIEAENARLAEAKARDEAEKAKQAEEYEAYIARIGLAAAKIEENAFDHAAQLLHECKPELRNWEWGRLMHLCGQSVHTYKADAPVDAVAFDADGRRAAAGSWDGKARIWTIGQQNDPLTIEYGGLYVHAIAFSPDGRYIATGGNDKAGFLKLWDAASGSLVRTFDGHSDSVLSIVFSKDGSRMLTSSYDKTARLWDVATGKELRKFAGHNWWVWSAVFSPDEQMVVTASQDGTAIVWALDKSQESSPPLFTGHAGPVYAAAISPDGHTVATGGYDGRILIWDLRTVKPFDFERIVSGDPLEPPKFRALEGHSAAVRAVRFSPDGRLLVSGSQDNSVKVWDVPTLKTLKTLRGHAGWVRSCAFSPDGHNVLSGSHDHLAKVWSIDGYEEIRVLQGRVLEGHADSVLAASFSPDGRRILTASRDRTARAWDRDTGQELHTYEEGHEFLASNAVFYPNLQRLLTSAVDNTVRGWDVSTGTQTMWFEHTGRSAALALSHDAKLILTGGDDKSAKLWDGETGKLVRSLPEHSADVTAVAFAPDDRTIFTGDNNGRGRLWSVDGRELARLNGHTRKVVAAQFTPDGQRVLTASGDNTVAQWNVADGRELPELVLKHPKAVTAMAVSPNGQIAVTSCADGEVRIWNLDRAEAVGALDDPSDYVSSVAISGDGRLALTASTKDRTVRVWDMATRHELAVPARGGQAGAFLDLKVLGGVVWSAIFSPDDAYVLTVGGDGARLWNLATAEERISFTPHGAVAAASFSPDGTRVVTGSWDNSAKIWNAETGQSVLKLEGQHTGYVNSATFSRDGSKVLTASDDRTACLWDLSTAKVLGVFRGHKDRVRSAVFSPDGMKIATASSDKTARIWDVAGEKTLLTLRGHVWPVLCVAFSADGNYLMTGSEDNSARVWDVETGRELLQLKGHTAPVTSAAFSPDGTRLLTGSRDNSCKLWDTARLFEARDAAAKLPADQALASVPTGKEILTLSSHSQEATAVTFSPDGRYVLTGSRDGTAILWLAVDWKQPGAVLTAGR